MKIKFLDSYSELDKNGLPDAYACGKEYDFIDRRKANYFLDHGLAVSVETVLENKPKLKAKNDLESSDTK